MLRYVLAIAMLFARFALNAADLQWKLVWSDEFDGSSLDPSKWEFEVNAHGGGNNELQYYKTNNVRVTGGVLTIEARKEHYTGPGGTRGTRRIRGTRGARGTRGTAGVQRRALPPRGDA